MRALLLLFFVAICFRVSSSTAVGSSFLRNAFAVSHYKALIRTKTSHSTRVSSRQSTTFENIPICDSAVGESAITAFNSCDGCIDQLLASDSDTSPKPIEDTCPERCCGDYSLESEATGHFIHCVDGCCWRLVELQVADDSTSEEGELASQFKIIVNNEYTVTGAGDFDRCELIEMPANDRKCGPRCAYLFNDPGRCEGRATVDVPVFGQNMDPANPPCSPAESPVEDGESSADGSAEANPSPTDGESGNENDDESDSDVCIDARSLQHLRPEELVFKEHRIAHVVCDATQSCATPGHVVVYRGQSMMMRSYCDLVVCSKKVMHVNSPRFGRRVRVPSKTQDLEFTAFAARYETRAEELLLSVAIRAGL